MTNDTILTQEMTTPQHEASDALYRKVGWRFMPLLFLCYIINYMDRTNVGFAHLQMQGDLHLTDVAYGLGAGMFFVSYAAFTLPTSLLFTKVGARNIIVACMVGWGLVSSATMLVHSPMQFYIVRFLLGVVEAGFFPAVVFYFSQWYPAQRRAAITGIFTAATVVAGIVSGVASGAIMKYMNGYAHLRGWQWMFVIEGLPAAFLGIGVYFYLDRDPREAAWLTDGEKLAIENAIANDPAAKTGKTSFSHAALDWRVYLVAVVYFLAVFDAFVLAFWQPAMIKSLGVTDVMVIGLYSTLPLIAAVVSKVYVGHSSDKNKEVRWHLAIPAFVGALGFVLAGIFPHSLVIGLIALMLATAGAHGCMPIVWVAPGLYLSGAAAASAVAIISTVGNVSGAVGPPILGYIKQVTGGFETGNYVLGGILALSGLLMLAFRVKPSERHTD